jgi:hypothetical protein
MARLPQPGGDAGSWGDILNDFLSQEHNVDGTLKRGPEIDQAKSDIASLQTSKADEANLDAHIGNVSNPHGVTKGQVGLSNVDNTADANKPISSATQTALSAKADQSAIAAFTPGDAKQVVGACPVPMIIDGPVNVKAKGAVGDGTTNDTTKFSAAMAAAGPTGARIDVPRATYGMGSQLVLKSGTLHLRGDSSASTTLKLTTNMSLIVDTTTAPTDHLILEDLTFDASSVSAVTRFLNTGVGLRRLTVRRCRFILSPKGGSGLTLKNIERVRIEDSDFFTYGDTAGTGIEISGLVGDLDILNNNFDWLQNGILLNGDVNIQNHNLVERVNVVGNHFDGYYYLGKTHFSGSGGTVTYTTSGMTDTAASFSGITTGFQTLVRAMPVRQQTSATTFSGFQVVATDGAFTTNGLVRGEIIRTDDGTKWAIVSAIVSATELVVESWLDTTTFQKVNPPANGTSITLWGIIQATISSFTATTLTNVLSWSSLDGHFTLPPPGTRYEIMYDRHNYHFNSTASVRDIKVTGNTFRRGFSDQCSVYGAQAIITDNDIMDGEDVGITHNGFIGGVNGQSIIAHNRIQRQGSVGIYSTAPNTIIEGNNIKGFSYVNRNDGAGAGVLFGGNIGHRTRVVNNIIDGEGRSEAFYGIIAGQADSASVLDNGITGVATDEVWVRPQPGPGYVTNLHLRGNYPRIKHRDSANTFNNPGMFYELRGSGSPEGAVIAGVGSTFIDMTNGKLYIKATGTDNTGWVVQA